jgi:protein required for attachment to host cells
VTAPRPTQPLRVRVLVADESEARFYNIAGPGEPLELRGQVSNPKAHQHDRDLKSDRPGRVFDHAPGTGRRGAVAHHATGGERRPRAEEARRFARRIARELAQAQQQDRCDRLVLIAGPRFLGTLRAALRKSVRDAVEVPRDLVHQGEEAVRQHLPGELFKPAASPGPQP